MIIEIQKKWVSDVCKDVLRLANNRCYGLGECGYYFLEYAWEEIQPLDYELLDSYELFKDDSQNYSEVMRLKAEQPEYYRAWQGLADKAEEMANQLDDMGLASNY